MVFVEDDVGVWREGVEARADVVDLVDEGDLGIVVQVIECFVGEDQQVIGIGGEVMIEDIFDSGVHFQFGGDEE